MASPVSFNPARHPVHLVLIVYHLALAGVWLTLFSKSALAPWMAVAHAVFAAVRWGLRRLPRLPRGVGALVDASPALALAFFWSELGTLQALRAAPAQDATVRWLDLQIFGVHAHEIWMRRMPQVWMSELMHFGYFLYYLVLAIPPFAILAVRGREAFRSATLAVLVTYLTCFLFYLAFPVYGPQALADPTHTAAPGGFFHDLVEGARRAGDSPGTAFPSSHVAGAVTMAWLAWRFLPRGWAAALSFAAMWIGLATVYTRNHYAIDAVLGFLWAIPLQAWLVPRFEGSSQGKATPAAPHAAEVSLSASP